MVVVNTSKKMPEKVFTSTTSQSQHQAGRLLTADASSSISRCRDQQRAHDHPIQMMDEQEEEEEEDVDQDEGAEEVALQPECDQQQTTSAAAAASATVPPGAPRRLSALPQRGLPSLNGSTFRGASSQRHLRITLYVNGDRHFPGRPYVINLDRIKTMDLLCAELTRLLVSVKSLPSGVRYMLDIATGTAVQSVGELAVGGQYAVSSTVRLVRSLHYPSLSLLHRHLAAVAAAAAAAAAANSPSTVDGGTTCSTSFYEQSAARNGGGKDSLLTRSTGAVSGGGGGSHHHHHHHHHKSAVFGAQYLLSTSAHLPRSHSPSSTGKPIVVPPSSSCSNGSSSLTLSASHSLHSNCGTLYTGSTVFGGLSSSSSAAIRPKIVALLRGSCRAAPSLRPSRRPIRFLLNYRIAQTFEQVLNEISAAVVASQCQTQVQQQHHQLNVGGAVHQLYGLATNKRITSLEDFLVDNEYVYLVYGRTERCTLLDFMLDECEQREITAIVGNKSSVTATANYQALLPGELMKQQLQQFQHNSAGKSTRSTDRQTAAAVVKDSGEHSASRAIRFHLTPKQSAKQWQSETADAAATTNTAVSNVTSTSGTATNNNGQPTQQQQPKPKSKANSRQQQPQRGKHSSSSRDGNNNDKEEVKAFSLPRNFLAHPKSAKSYHSHKGSEAQRTAAAVKSERRVRAAAKKRETAANHNFEADNSEHCCANSVADQQSALNNSLPDNHHHHNNKDTAEEEQQSLSSLSSCFSSSVYSLKEDLIAGDADLIGLPYDSHHILKNSTSENVLGEAFYRDRHHLPLLYPDNISNSLVYDSSHHHQQKQKQHHHHHHHPRYHNQHSLSPHSPYSPVQGQQQQCDQQSDTTTSSDRENHHHHHQSGSSNLLVGSFSGSSSTTTTTTTTNTPGAASSVSCSEDFSTFATGEEGDYSASEMMYSYRQKAQLQPHQRGPALRSSQSSSSRSSSSSDSSTPSFSSLSCTVRAPGTTMPTSSLPRAHHPSTHASSSSPSSAVSSGHRSNRNGSSKSGSSTNSTPKHRPTTTATFSQKGTPKRSHHPQKSPEFNLDDDEPPIELEGNEDDDDEEEDEVDNENDENLPYKEEEEEEEAQLPPAKRHLPLVPKKEVGRLYQIGEAIGDGKFGVVYTCSQRGSGRVYALKVVDKGAMQEMMAKSSSGGQDHQAAGGQQRRSPPPMSSNSANTEAAILKRISHPNIVKIYDHFEYVDQSYLVLELFKGGDLFDAITSAGRYSESESREMFRDLMEALAYLHRHHIIHRDIKLENLMVAFVPLTATTNNSPSKGRTSSSSFSSNSRYSTAAGVPGSSSNSIIVPPGRRYRQAIKLADFGLATEILPNELLFTVCGTPTYVAPEILLEIGYTYPVDIWAAGVIAFILLCGYPPFANEENNQDLLFDQILAGRFDFDDRHWAEVGEPAKALIAAMLNTEQSARLTADQVLAHPWLSAAASGNGRAAGGGKKQPK